MSKLVLGPEISLGYRNLFFCIPPPAVCQTVVAAVFFLPKKAQFVIINANNRVVARSAADGEIS